MFVKALDQITSKWSQRASQAGSAYAAGVAQPRTPWAAATAKAKDAWAAGVTAAVNNGRFASGVNAAGDSKWQTGATGKGARNYPTGVQGQQAQQNFSAGFGKFQAALSNFTLPPRFAKGDPNNLLRSAAVTNLLHNLKLGKS